MNIKHKNRKGSITIIAIFIFVLILSSSTLILYFATLQSSLSKNQLEKMQSRYIVEDNLNKFICDNQNIEKYIKDRIFTTYRSNRIPLGGVYHIKFEEGDKFKEDIQKASFRLEDLNGRKDIILYIDSEYKNINSNLVASGTCISKIFELGQAYLIEERLSLTEKELFSEFIDRIEEENVEYDCKLDSNSRKININEDLFLKLIRETNKEDKMFSEKDFFIKSGEEKRIIRFTHESMIINLKRNEDEVRTLTIGDIDNKGLIKLNGVLYIEGDLIINQDFEFSGLIIINQGNIIINSMNKPKFNGAVYYRGENLEVDKMDLIYNQEVIYKEGSFLPGFIDIEINTIKRF